MRLFWQPTVPGSKKALGFWRAHHSIRFHAWGQGFWEFQYQVPQAPAPQAAAEVTGASTMHCRNPLTCPHCNPR